MIFMGLGEGGGGGRSVTAGSDIMIGIIIAEVPLHWKKDTNYMSDWLVDRLEGLRRYIHGFLGNWETGWWHWWR